MNMCRTAKLLISGLLCAVIFTGCVKKDPRLEHVEPFHKVGAVGEVPEILGKAVENNSFRGIAAFDGRLLKAETGDRDETNRTAAQKVGLLDIYGNVLASYTETTDDAYHVSTPTAASDGGFLFVLGFRDYAYGQDAWASDDGFSSRIVKCDKDGNVQFSVPFDGMEGEAFRYCFEKNGCFYFFGTKETPETKIRGVGSKTDVYLCVLDGNGSLLNSRCIRGSDYDSLQAAEVSGDGFILSVSSQSDDGDFAGSDSRGYPVDWVFTVNDGLEITEKKKGSGRDYSDTVIGEKDGMPVYQSDALFDAFDAGKPTAYIDYGDFYLIVSENTTGIYGKTPAYISSLWYLTETVYSGYDKNGTLLFRTAVDSSPDYDAMTDALQKD